MSPTVNNFVHDLVAMAKAMEDLPHVQAELDSTKADLEQSRVVVQNRELSILNLKAEIETLQAKVRTTEAERDDAEIRFLELDEKTNKVLANVAAIQANALAVQESLNPPKPVPMPEPEAQQSVHEAASEVMKANAEQAQGHESTGIMPAPAPEQGQGEVNPISISNLSGQQATDAPIAQESSISSEAFEPAKGPYSGLRYYDHPTYVPLSQWLEGGGSKEDYNWRPGFEAPRSPTF